MMKKSEGKMAIDVSRATKDMKEIEKAPSGGEPVRTAGGKTYIWKNGSWTDTEIADNLGKVLKVKYLSEAYFKLLSLKPELKEAMALGDRVTVKVANGKSVQIAPNEGEDSGEKISAFVK